MSAKGVSGTLIQPVRAWRRLAGVVVLVAAVMVAGAGPVGSAPARGNVLSTWEQFLADRPELLRTLAPPIVNCSLRNDHSESSLFRGCVDWHSAVHGAYSLHAISHRTGDPAYRDVVEPFITPEAIAAERLPSYELPYGYAWFLALVREREQSTGKRDLHGLADTVAARMATWFSTMDDVLRALTIVDPAVGPPYPGAGLFGGYRNYSWGLIHLYDWAKYTQDEALLAVVHSATTELMDPQWDALCPPAQDASPVSPPLSFMPPCLMRVAAVAHVLGAAAKEWVTARTAGLYIAPIVTYEPVTGGAGLDCHRGGQNFYRAFTLYPIYRATGNTLNRDNYVDLIRYMVTRSDIWNGNYCYSHWIAQVGVRAIALSYSLQATLEYTGETVIANRHSATLSALLREGDNGAGLSGRTVQLTLGTGAEAQGCTIETDAAGRAACTISVAQPNGPGVVSATFAGDSSGGLPIVAEKVPYDAASASAETLVYDFAPGGGAFVVGDGNAVPGASVTFWGSEWSKSNTLSGGKPPAGFKGFASDPARPGCGSRWGSDLGKSAAPPGPLPDYIGVIVTGSVTKSAGTAKVRGDSKHIVVVKTESYSPSGSGTGTVAANVCSLLEAQLPEVSIGSPAEGGLVDPGDQIAYTVAVTDPQDGSTASGSIGCDAVTVELVQVEESEEVALESQHACVGGFSLPPDPAQAGERVLGFLVRASYTDKGHPLGIAPITDVAETALGLKRVEVENVDPTLSSEPSTDPEGAAGDQDVVLAPGSVVSLGFVSLDRLTGIRFRTFSADGALELRRDSASGPLLASASVASSEWRTISAPLAASGGHSLFLVASGEPLRLNWLEFAGAGAASNQRPQVSASLTPTEGQPPLTVEFSAEGTDPEGDQNLSYSWDFGDGQRSSEPDPSHEYAEPGSYRPSLTVRDSAGAVWRGGFTVNVAVNSPPIVCDAATSTPGPSDEFEGDRLDGCRWNAVVRPNLHTLWVAEGALNLVLKPGTFPTLILPCVSTSTLVCPPPENLILQQASPTEDWTIETKFDVAVASGRVGVIAYHDDLTWVQLSVTPFRVEATSSELGVLRGSWSISVANPGTSWWLRLSKRGVTYTTQVSTDGSAWTTFAPSALSPTSSTNPAILEPKLGLIATGGSSFSPPSFVAFDYFKLTKP